MVAKSIGAITALLSVVCVASSCNSEYPNGAIAQAVLNQDWTAVTAEARQIKRQGRGGAVVDWLLGYGSLMSGNPEAAVESFAKLGKPDSGQQLLHWAKEVAQDNPDSPIAQVLYGDALARKRRYTQALRTLDEAIRLDPTSALSYDVRGIVWALTGSVERAASDFEAANQLAPDFGDPVLNLGVLRLAEGDLVAARLFLDDAVRACPNLALTHNARGALFGSLSAYEDAQSEFHKARWAAPTIPWIGTNSSKMAKVGVDGETRGAFTSDSQGVVGPDMIPERRYERHSVDIGDGRTVDVFRIRNMQRTTTVEGVQDTLRQIVGRLRQEISLPAEVNWRPKILIAQTGLGCGHRAESHHLAKMAFYGGKDFVVSVDTSDAFQWPRDQGDLSRTQVSGDVTRRLERVVVAARRVSGSPPDLVLQSQANLFLIQGRQGSTTLADLHAWGQLHPEFRVNRLVAIGYPVSEQRLAAPFRQARFANVISLASARREALGSRFGFTAAEPLLGEAKLELAMRNGAGVPHALLSAQRWYGNQVNPIPELVGQYLRGSDVSSLQRYADRLRDAVPVAFTQVTDPISVHFSRVALVRRGLTDPGRDGILLGCRDATTAAVLRGFYGPQWRVEVVATSDVPRLQRLARANGFTRIHAVFEHAPTAPTDSKLGVLGALALPVDLNSPSPGFPELRSLASAADRFNDVINLFCELTPDVTLSPLSDVRELIGPLLQDVASWQETGEFRFVDSFVSRGVAHGSVKVVVLWLAKSAKGTTHSWVCTPVVDNLPYVVRAVSDGEWTPTVVEFKYLMKAVVQVAGGLVGIGLPGGPVAWSIGAGLAFDFVVDIIEQEQSSWQLLRAVRKDMIQRYLDQLKDALGKRQRPKKFSDMYDVELLRELGFDEATIQRYDDLADIGGWLRKALRSYRRRDIPPFCQIATVGRCIYPWFGSPPPSSPLTVAISPVTFFDDQPPPPDRDGVSVDSPPPPRPDGAPASDRPADRQIPIRKKDPYGRDVIEYRDHQWVIKKNARGGIVSFKIRILIRGKWRDLELPYDVYDKIRALLQAGADIRLEIIRHGNSQVIYVWVNGKLVWVITVGPSGNIIDIERKGRNIIDIKRKGISIGAVERLSQYGEKADTSGRFAFEEGPGYEASKSMSESTTGWTSNEYGESRAVFCPFVLFCALPPSQP